MPVVAIKCPNCGGSVKMDMSMTRGVCAYCKSTINVQEAIQKVKIDNTQKIESYLVLAETARKNEQYEQAEAYANRILEEDAYNIKGWLLKCNVMADLSEQGDYRLPEIAIAIENILQLWIEADRVKLLEELTRIFTRAYMGLVRAYTFIVTYRIKNFKESENNVFDSVAMNINTLISIVTEVEGFEQKYHCKLENRIPDFAAEVNKIVPIAIKTMQKNCFKQSYSDIETISKMSAYLDILLYTLYSTISNLHVERDNIRKQAMKYLIDLCDCCAILYRHSKLYHYDRLGLMEILTLDFASKGGWDVYSYFPKKLESMRVREYIKKRREYGNKVRRAFQTKYGSSGIQGINGYTKFKFYLLAKRKLDL